MTRLKTAVELASDLENEIAVAAVIFALAREALASQPAAPGGVREALEKYLRDAPRRRVEAIHQIEQLKTIRVAKIRRRADEPREVRDLRCALDPVWEWYAGGGEVAEPEPLEVASLAARDLVDDRAALLERVRVLRRLALLHLIYCASGQAEGLPVHETLRAEVGKLTGIDLPEAPDSPWVEDWAAKRTAASVAGEQILRDLKIDREHVLSGYDG